MLMLLKFPGSIYSYFTCSWCTVLQRNKKKRHCNRILCNQSAVFQCSQADLRKENVKRCLATRKT